MQTQAREIGQLDREPLEQFLPKPRLDALTSLRFFAAAMIVALHALPIFGFDYKIFVKAIPLAQGVSFFFVLSGFILTYVYQDLRGAKNIGRFITARIARIWPGHIVATCLALCVIRGVVVTPGDIVSNLLMVQSWSVNRVSWPINPVSWSISTEFFFYICFIALIRPWKFGWWGKLGLSFGLLIPSLLLAVGWAPLASHFSAHGDPDIVVYTQPIPRLAEFVLGMAICAAWLKLRVSLRISKKVATILELLALGAIPLEFYLLSKTLSLLGNNLEPVACWLINCACGPAFALIIFVMAFQAGYISSFLTAPLLVWLGEISYSIYLLHYPLVQYIAAHRCNLDGLSNWSVLVLYLLLVLVCSDLNYVLVETPLRGWLRKPFIPRGASFEALIKNLAQAKPRHCLIALEALLLVAIVFAINTGKGSIKLAAINLPKEINFGDRFVLEKAAIGHGAEGSIELIPYWRSLAKQRLDFCVAVHIIDANGKILTQQDYPQTRELARSNQHWSDSIYIPGSSLKGATAVALAIYHPKPMSLLSIDRGQRDWNNHRLILTLSSGN
jgi:peptidoglycan/LPS O-acetylase OafA/YrhL